jgi:hypothetical protein
MLFADTPPPLHDEFHQHTIAEARAEDVSADIEAKQHRPDDLNGVLPLAVLDCKCASAEPMKVILPSQSQEQLMAWRYQHVRSSEDMDTIDPFHNMKLSDQFSGHSFELDMMSDPHRYWPHFQTLELESCYSPMHETGSMAFGPNPGSLLHGTGRCSPCAWYWKWKGCSNGMGCEFCHVCPEGELKARRKLKIAAMRSGALTPKSQDQRQHTMKDVGVLSLSSLV